MISRNTVPTPDTKPPRMSRRGFLKATAAAGIAAVGVTSLSACTADDELADATLSVSAQGPYKPVPDAAARAKSPGEEAYAQALQAWLDDNPGVKLKSINAEVWNKEAMVTAIAGGTAPAIYYANVIGSWYDKGIQQAFAQGLCADVTDLLKKHKVADRLDDGIKKVWEKSWNLDGAFYAVPQRFTVGSGVHYRRDLIAELGLKEPAAGWTWKDVRTLAKALTKGNRKGIVLQTWPMTFAANDCEGMGLLAALPTPETSWHWTYDYNTFAEEFAHGVENLRGMNYEDGSATVDISLQNDEPRQAFVRGEACMHVNNIHMYTLSPGGQDSTSALEQSVGKPLDEVVGWAVMPGGLSGYGRPGMSAPEIQAISFSPDLGKNELAAAFSLHMHMVSEGLVKKKEALYSATNDLRRVYDSDTITPVLKEVSAGLPGKPEDAWGKRFIETVRAANAIPPRPNEAWFIPPEQDAGANDEVFNDTMSKWWYDARVPDIAADLKRLGDVRNQQNKSFSSSVSKEDFIAGARKYYEAHSEYWQKHSPDFYRDMFEPWYSEHVRPNLD